MLGLKQWLIHYCHDVINGKVVACQKHIWACMRFLRDVEREGTEEFPFVFDEDKAMRFFEWMSTFKHTQGVLQGQRIQPHEIQVFVFSNIYGWVHKETGYRRFKKAYWQVARKNAKSQSLACVATYEAMAFGQSRAEVYIGATKTEQSQIVYNEVRAQLNGCEELKGKWRESYGRIKHIKSDSVIRPLSKEDGKKGDGFNPQCGIIDEYHAHETDEILNVLQSGMVARPEPLIMVITTAGSDPSNPCYRVEYLYVERLLNPHDSVENDTYFAMVNELDRDEEGNLLDDIRDEKAWEKANPIVCSYPEGIENLRSKLVEALEKPEYMDDFLTKNMNIWINRRPKSYLQAEKWAACKVDQLPDLRGKECYVGVDLSDKVDLSSVVFEFPLGDGQFLVLHHSFMPEDTINTRKKTDKVPYDRWVRQGFLTATPGPVVDHKFIEQYIVDQEENNGWIVKEICYDPRSATQFSQNMADRGYTVVEIRQGVWTLSEPTKHFRESVLQKKIQHIGDEVLSWAVGNAVTKQDHNGNIMLDKSKSTERIDPIAAAINAHVRAMFNVDGSIDVSEFSSEEFLKRLWG